MNDISMCENEECIKKDVCYRQTAHASNWQSWGDFEPKNNTEEGFDCDYFWERSK